MLGDAADAANDYYSAGDGPGQDIIFRRRGNGMTREKTTDVGPGHVLSARMLNRALLARQMLLEPADMTAEQAVEHLVGMQAQSPQAPYVGLWARLKDFHTDELAGLIEARLAVRVPLMRTTLHLVTTGDCLGLRRLMQPMLDRGFAGSPFSKLLDGVDIAEVLSQGERLLADSPLTTVELGRLLAERWPGRDAEALGQAVRLLVPAVQVPPRGIWGKSGLPRWAPVETWLARPLDARPSIEDIVLRYLGAFGPASVMDVQAWCWLTRLGDTLERLRPRLVVFRDEAGRELFDLPDAPRPDPETPAPVCFIPEYDNLLLSHADRSRVVSEAGLKQVFGKGAVLLDGFVSAAWKIARARRVATLQIEPLGKLTKKEMRAVEKEGLRLLELVAGGFDHAIRFGI